MVSGVDLREGDGKGNIWSWTWCLCQQGHQIVPQPLDCVCLISRPQVNTTCSTTSCSRTFPQRRVSWKVSTGGSLKGAIRPPPCPGEDRLWRAACLTVPLSASVWLRSETGKATDGRTSLGPFAGQMSSLILETRAFKSLQGPGSLEVWSL